MNKKQPYQKVWLAFAALTFFFWPSMPASAQSVPAQDNRPIQDGDTTRQELARFDQFLDKHRDIAEQLHKDPSLVNNQEFVKNHPALQDYLQDHPGIREEIKENPNAFMHAENRYDHREDDRDRDRTGDRDTTRRESASFDQFLDKHRETAEQLRKDPSLVDNKEFVKNHPALQDYLQDHPNVREEIKENPNSFMHAENRYDRREDNRDRTGDRDTTRRELASFDQFLDKHRETAEQLRKNSSLVDNKEFLKNHPALQDYLQDHPDVRKEFRENPNAFMQAENRYDRRENDRNRDRIGDRDTTRRELASFDQFLDKHREIAEQLRKDPSLVDNKEFVKNHPALQDYLQDHPNVREEVKENPNSFTVAENRYDRHEEGMNRDQHEDHMDRDALHQHFGAFLGGHSEVAQQLSKDPSLVKNQEFLENHPELKEYLNAHPDVRKELMANPQSFVKSAQQMNNNSSSVKTPTTTANPKPKQ